MCSGFCKFLLFLQNANLRLISIITKLDFKMNHIKTAICAGALLLLMLAAGQDRALCQPSGKNLGLKTVVIDPGHGGKDPGAPGQTSKTHEKHIVLSVSKLLGDMIKEAYPDVKVVYTRSSDVFIGLHERAMTAKRNKADLFISVHCNSSSNKSACGTSVHILGKNSKNGKNKTDYFEKNMSVAQRENGVIVLEDGYEAKYADFDVNSPESYISHMLQWTAYYESSLLFASEVVDKLIQKPLTRRPVVIDQDVFQVLVEAQMPAVLIELAFISNPSEYRYLASAAGQKEMASRLFKAFRSYKTHCDASVGATESTSVQDCSNTETSAITEEKAAEVPYYGIQIMGLGRQLKKGDPAFKGIDAKAIRAPGSNIYKYVSGNYRTKQEASAALKAVKAKFPEAFVVKVEDGTVCRP